MATWFGLEAWPAHEMAARRSRADLQRSSFPALISCPDCELPAEVVDWFSLDSTDGPVDHVALGCIDGHHFRMALDRLPADVQAQLKAGPAQVRERQAMTQEPVAARPGASAGQSAAARNRHGSTGHDDAGRNEDQLGSVS
jgi:hypothetical protein